MGRFLLLIVASVSVTGGYAAYSRASANSDLSQRQGSVEEIALARQAAQSGFDDALHQVSLAVGSIPPSGERAVGDGAGTYRYDIAQTPYGALELTSRGRYGAGRYVVQGEVLDLLRTGAAVTVHGEAFKGKLGDDAVIDGSDRRVPGAPGEAGPAGSNLAIAYTDPELRAEADDQLGSPPGLIGGTGLTAHPGAIAALAEALVEAPETQTYQTLTLANDALGTPLDPVVVHVTKKAQLKQGAVGYGVLILDADLEMSEDARWEGLVVVRAAANEKRKVKMEDQAEILGAVVLLGAEYLVEEPGDPGFPGGHMDLDLFEGDGAPLPRTYHQHEWDDKYNLTYLDFVRGPDIGPDFSRFVAERHPLSSLRVVFDNAFNSAGTYTVGPHSGRTEHGFETTLEVRHLDPFVVRFDALCALRGTSPGRVKSDPLSRDRSFTVRFFDGPTQVYAVSAYEHAKTLRDGSPSCGADSGETSETTTDTYGEFKLELKDESAIRYSEEAAGRVARTSEAVRDLSRTFPVLIRSVPVVAPEGDGPADDDGPPPGPPPPPAPPTDGVVICHKPGKKNQTKTVPAEDAPSHLGHGDTLGPCPGG